MTLRIVPRYEDHLWYPILVKCGSVSHIVELQGKEVNAWNDMVERQREEDTKNYPRGWYI